MSPLLDAVPLCVPALFAQSETPSPWRDNGVSWAMMIPIVAIVAGTTAGIVATVMTNWRKRKEHEDLAILKQQMLDRGMAPDDIVRVAAAGLDPKRG